MLRDIHPQLDRPLLFITNSDRELDTIRSNIAFFAPHIPVLTFPAWDCLPYDRVSPHTDAVSQRLRTLSALAHNPGKPYVVLTTVNAASQRVPPKSALTGAMFGLRAGEALDRAKLQEFFTRFGYRRAEKVIEPGEYAIRGSIIDVMSPGGESGIRVDLFGDEIEQLRLFDPLTQISSEKIESATLEPTSEIVLSPEAVEHFRMRYREAFGAVSREDPLYESISAGRVYAGMEHWLPLFYGKLETLWDYVPGAAVMLDYQAGQAFAERMELVQDYYRARKDAEQMKAQGGVYHPLPPNALYLEEKEWEARLNEKLRLDLTPFAGGETPSRVREGGGNASFPHLTSPAGGGGIIDLGFTPSPKHRTGGGANVFEFVKAQFAGAKEKQRALLLACQSNGSRERIQSMLLEHDLHAAKLDKFHEGVSRSAVQLAILPVEEGFESPAFIVLSEQDVFGERILRTGRKRKKVENFLAEAANFQPGEPVVHKEHGIGRFEGLVTLEVNDTRHDCIKLIYEGEDKLFVPVENIDLIGRYGSDAEGVKLDKLGSAAWQSRKAKLKERIQLAAEALLKVAAERALHQAERLAAPQGMYDEFISRFPYTETEDQAKAIQDVLEDLESGKPTDRLVCGDVGFGKTEVALRAAFVAASHMNEKGRTQVALICPTTLLARQHFQTFTERFAGLPLKVKHLSRMVTAKEAKATMEGLKEGTVDIVIGTHALLGKGVEFKNLGLLIIDEEQHFGVAQKEKLKSLKNDVHVLTLSATPIPRTLQMALTGVRELSLITTPPVDRLAVRSFVMPYDPVAIREAILREYHRGGKIFYVTPRVKYIAELHKQLSELVPEIRIGVGHGQMTAPQLDKVMNEFYDSKFELLLSTTIVESGLDIPSANTIIIDRAHMFGLSQLYQLRGRVGRGKTRAYAYFTLPHRHALTDSATRRLEVMQSLDTLGAGFTIASHDMDIRGFGNLLGEEQSGHVKEVGIELYQQMLQEAVDAARRGTKEAPAPIAEDWSPSINLGTSVLIPESYVADLQLRLSLYRRLSSLENEADIDSFAAELTDRFGPLPPEVEQLLAVVRIKQICKQAGIERVDAGNKGAVLTFRRNRFANPEALLKFISKNTATAKLRPDHKLVLIRDWEKPETKLKGVSQSLQEIATLAA
jgi:transcription-repair coupling factor (superfamily II helicase)